MANPDPRVRHPAANEDRERSASTEKSCRRRTRSEGSCHTRLLHDPTPCRHPADRLLPLQGWMTTKRRAPRRTCGALDPRPKQQARAAPPQERLRRGLRTARFHDNSHRPTARWLPSTENPADPCQGRAQDGNAEAGQADEIHRADIRRIRSPDSTAVVAPHGQPRGGCPAIGDGWPDGELATDNSLHSDRIDALNAVDLWWNPPWVWHGSTTTLTPSPHTVTLRLRTSLRA